MEKNDLLIVGAGPAGLTAAYQSIQKGIKPVVLEKHCHVGGIATTKAYKGFFFDLGGHRFYSSSQKVNNIWHDILKSNFKVRDRSSCILFNDNYLDYPLNVKSLIRNISPLEGFRFAKSYLWWHLFPYRPEKTFEHWVTNRFGRSLFNTFFKSYTEKVWGIPCSELNAEWAAQRIKNLSLKNVITNLFFKPKQQIRSFVDEFHYPDRGAGMMWEEIGRFIEQNDGSVHINHNLVELQRDGFHVSGAVAKLNESLKTFSPLQVISSIPITELVKMIVPAVPDVVMESATNLRYRDFITVCLLVDKEQVFPHQWIYIHDPKVRVGRIQNYKNWDAEMVPDQGKTGLGLEYFCNIRDDLWRLTNEELIQLAKEELIRLNLVDEASVMDGVVYRVPKAYPVYDAHYKNNIDIIREFVDRLDNFQTIGRNGLFRYNNMDHSMLTAIYAVDNIISNSCHDVWQVNDDRAYLEGPGVSDRGVSMDLVNCEK